MKLLSVEDDPALAKMLHKAMSEEGYETSVVGDGGDALAALDNDTFDVILLDVMLPTYDGFEVCRRIRSRGLRTPILMLTARDTTKDKVEGLDAGADDYLVKPFQVAELLARVRALLRRGATGTPTVLQVGDLVLDPATRVAKRGYKEMRLSATEYALLEYLMRNEGKVLNRASILEHVWQYHFNGNDNVLDVYIGYLRGKIDKGFDNSLIHTVRGVGFQMADRTKGTSAA
ncbi:response regulator transcription factor [bacterium]|nr:MAG: response regulator transcription factor [bacterium]